MSFANYSIDKVTVTWLGIDITEGLAEGTSIQEAKANARWTMVMGAKGRGTRSKNPNRNGSLTFTIDQASKTHNILTTIAKADDLSEDKVGDLVIRDRSSGREIVYQNAFLEDVPDEAFGQTASTFAWVFLYQKKDPKPPAKLVNVVGS